jgi:ABC-type sugar transport system ATPase subunit
MNITNLWAGYDVPILKGIHWNLIPGTRYGLLGENGSGKTTLGKVLQDQIPVLHGSIDGITKPPKVKPNPWVQIVPQHPDSLPSLTVADLVRLIGLGSKKNAHHLIDTYCLFCEPTTRLDELSMSSLALLYGLIAIELNPKLIFFDETTATMAPDQVEVFFNFVTNYVQKGGIAVLVSHRLEELSYYCDELIILRDGKVAETHKQGTSPQQLAKGMFFHHSNNLTQQQIHFNKTQHSNQDLKNSLSRSLWYAENLKVSSDQTHHWGVSNLSAQLYPGEVFTVLGLKEQGIELLEDTLVGLRIPEHGTISELSHLGNLNFGYIPRNRITRGLFPGLSVADNSALHARSGLTSGITSQNTSDSNGESSLSSKGMLKMFSGTQPEPGLVVSTLSGGMAQRLLIERELATKAKAFLLCEPGLGLDPNKKHELYETIHEMRNQGTGFLLLTSDVDEAMILSDRIQVLYQGNLVTPDLSKEQDISSPRIREILSDMMVGVDNHG